MVNFINSNEKENSSHNSKIKKQINYNKFVFKKQIILVVNGGIFSSSKITRGSKNLVVLYELYKQTFCESN